MCIHARVRPSDDAHLSRSTAPLLRRSRWGRRWQRPKRLDSRSRDSRRCRRRTSLDASPSLLARERERGEGERMSATHSRSRRCRPARRPSGDARVEMPPGPRELELVGGARGEVSPGACRRVCAIGYMYVSARARFVCLCTHACLLLQVRVCVSLQACVRVRVGACVHVRERVSECAFPCAARTCWCALAGACVCVLTCVCALMCDRASARVCACCGLRALK